MLKKLALVIVLVLIGLVGGVIYLLNMSQQGFIEHNTQINWPDQALQIKTITDPSFMKSNWVEAHFKLPPPAMENFIKQEHFKFYQPDLKDFNEKNEVVEDFLIQKSIIRDPQNPLGFLRGYDQFSAERLTISSLDQLAYISGNKTGEHPFTIVADRKNGSVWIHMNHPD